jgi:hypothetical protein
MRDNGTGNPSASHFNRHPLGLVLILISTVAWASAGLFVRLLPFDIWTIIVVCRFVCWKFRPVALWPQDFFRCPRLWRARCSCHSLFDGNHHPVSSRLPTRKRRQRCYNLRISAICDDGDCLDLAERKALFSDASGRRRSAPRNYHYGRAFRGRPSTRGSALISLHNFHGVVDAHHSEKRTY